MNIMTIFKFILGMKFGWLLLIGIGLILGLSVVKNIISGTFSVTKLAGGFNILSGPIQGKLIYYGVMAILAFGLYHQLTRATTNYDTDYKNQIKGNQDVIIDQRVGPGCVPTKILWGLIQFGCKPASIDNSEVYNGLVNTECSKCKEESQKKDTSKKDDKKDKSKEEKPGNKGNINK